METQLPITRAKRGPATHTAVLTRILGRRTKRQRRREIAPGVICHHQPPHDLDAARSDLETLLTLIHDRLDKGELFQADLERGGANHVTVWKFLRGKSVRHETVRMIADADGASPEDVRDRAVRAAELLHSHALSQARATRSDRFTPPQPVPNFPPHEAYTEGGWKLVVAVYKHWGSPARFLRDVGMRRGAWTRWRFDRMFHPRRDLRDRVAQALTQKGMDRASVDALLAKIGAGSTLEEWRRSSASTVPSRCPTCGGRRSAGAHNCRRCDAFHRIVRAGVSTRLGKLIVSLLAAALYISPARTADLLGCAVPTVKAWLHGREDTIRAIGSAVDEGLSPLRATARALHVSVEVVDSFLHHPDRRYLRSQGGDDPIAALRQSLDLMDEALRTLSGRPKTMRDFWADRGPRWGLNKWCSSSNGRPIDPVVHRTAKIITEGLLHGDIATAATRRRTVEAISQRLQDRNLPLPDNPRDFMIQHARRCRVLRSRVAKYLRHREKKTVRAIADLLDVSVRTAFQDCK